MNDIKYSSFEELRDQTRRHSSSSLVIRDDYKSLSLGVLDRLKKYQKALLEKQKVEFSFLKKRGRQKSSMPFGAL